MSKRRPGSRSYSALNAKRWAHVRAAVFRRDGHRCQLCGKASALECDHITPLDKGGDPYAEENLQTLCRGCHLKKSADEHRRPDPERVAWREVLAEIAKS